MSQSIYYVYAYLREDGSPYYIGKGKGRRAFVKHPGTNPPKDRSRIVFIATDLTDLWSLALERRLIRWYGRKNNNSGILRNLTDGGDGSSGLKHKEESKNKMRGPRGPMSEEERMVKYASRRGSRGPLKKKRGPMTEDGKAARRGPQKNPAANRKNKRGYWWNNGVVQKQSFEPPGEGFMKGHLKGHKL